MSASRVVSDLDLPAGKGDLTTKLVASLKSMIALGELRPGSRFPPERELSQRFGVSRPSLRQALKVLEIMGVLSQRVGDGTYLSSNASAILSEPMEFLILLDGISSQELYEARLIVEPELAARAAERASPEDIAVLAKLVNEMEQKTGDSAVQIALDLAFHSEIFRTAGNRVCRQMFQVIHRGIMASGARTSVRANFVDVAAEHRAICEAITRHSPAEAKRVMAVHLENAGAVATARASGN